MKKIIIYPKDLNELEFVKQLLKKLKIKSKVISEHNTEIDKIPNKKTLKAMKEAEKGNLKTYDSVSSFIEALNS